MKGWFRIGLRVFWIAIVCNSWISSVAQQEVFSPKYMYTQYFLNPAYSGTSNALEGHMMARKQWFGIPGAPSNYRLAAYSPINETLMSVGGSLSMEQFGINKLYSATAAYAYLLKISPKTFLSLGIGAQVGMHQIAFGDLALNDPSEDRFSKPTESRIAVNAASGAYFYSENYYLGLSVTNILGAGDDELYYEINQLQQQRQYYASAGYSVTINEWIALKPSVLFRYENKENYNLTGGLQMLYQDIFWVGASYAKDGYISGMFNFNFFKELGVGYVFDMGIGNNMINRSSHEIVISTNLDFLLDRNKNREFGGSKRKKGGSNNSIKSMRSF